MNNITQTNNEVSQINERTSTTISNIKNLQELERNLYADLENSASSSNPPPLEEQEMIITRINDLSNMRSTLFGNLKDLYSTNQYEVAQTRNDLVDELTTIKVIEGELNNSKSQLNALNQQKKNKLRMVEINTYYGKRYEAQANIMLIIIITCVPILIITILNKKNLIPDNISTFLISLVIVVFLIVMYFRVGDFIFRDNMDFDQIKFPFDPTDVDTDSSNTNVVQLPDALDLSIECIGEACCTEDGMEFDATKNECILTNSDSAQLTKEAFSMNDTNIKLKGGSSVSPWRSGNVMNYNKI
jgi:hypothetical protein